MTPKTAYYFVTRPEVESRYSRMLILLRRGSDVAWILHCMCSDKCFPRILCACQIKECTRCCAPGAGKTHTMLGMEEDPGINFRTMRELFRCAAFRD